MDAVAIFTQAYRFVTLDGVATTKLGENAVLLRMRLGRNDLQDGLTDHLLCRKTEQPFRRGVPGGDDARQRFAGDGSFRRGNDRGQRPAALLAGAISHPFRRGELWDLKGVQALSFSGPGWRRTAGATAHAISIRTGVPTRSA